MSEEKGMVSQEAVTATSADAGSIMPLAADLSRTQDVTTVSEVSTINSTDQFYMNQSGKFVQVDYSKLADAILGKISSKTYSLDQGTKTLIAAINELNSNSIFGSTTIKTYTKQLSAESDYVTLAEISASSNDIIIVKTRWITGKPTGVKILDKDSQTLYAINEDDTGYINLFFSPTVIRQTHSLIVQVKNLNPDGFSGIDLIQIHFEQK